MTLDLRRPPLAAAVFFLTVAAMPQPAAAQTGVRIAAAAGLGGATRPGRWTPVRITLENDGPGIAGELVIQADTARVGRVMRLPSPSRKHVEMFVRIPSTDVDRIHVGFVSDGHEVASADAAVAYVAEDTPFVLCVAADEEPRAPRCSAAVNAGALPSSWRGFDPVDEVAWPHGERPALSLDQQIAIARWQSLRAHEMLVAPASAAPAAPDMLRRARGMLGVYAACFVALAAGARRATRRPRLFYACVAVLPVAGAAGVLADGRVGRSAVPVIVDATIVRAAEDLDGAFITSKGRASVPASGPFTFRASFPDGFISGRTDAQLDFAEDEASELAGAFGKGQNVPFEVAGFADVPTLRVERDGEKLHITNVSGGELSDCELQGGLTPRQVARLGPSARVDAIDAGAADAALTCRMSAPLATVKSTAGAVERRGSSVLVYALRRGEAR